MKPKHTTVGTHISWRASTALRKRFQRFLEVSPPCDRTQYLEVALTHYLDSIAKHGLNVATLYPKK